MFVKLTSFGPLQGGVYSAHKLKKKYRYSQICVQLHPLGPGKSGRCSEVVVIQGVGQSNYLNFNFKKCV